MLPDQGRTRKDAHACLLVRIVFCAGFREVAKTRVPLLRRIRHDRLAKAMGRLARRREEALRLGGKFERGRFVIGKWFQYGLNGFYATSRTCQRAILSDFARAGLGTRAIRAIRVAKGRLWLCCSFAATHG